MIPYGRQSIDETDIEAVAEVLRSDWLTTGPAVAAFESALAEVAGARCVAVNSGTAALHAAYAVVGLGPGTELVTTPLTFAGTATAALHLGATVRFADVEDDTLNLDPAAAAEAISPATRVVTGVDYAGQPCAVDELRKLAHEAGARFVEDAAHAIGGRTRGRPVGSVADLTCFSFHPVKTVTTGEGGAIATTDPALLVPLQRFRSHGIVLEPADMEEPDVGGWHREIHELGLNYRLPDVLAALGTSQLRRLPMFVDRRRALVERYRALLAEVDDVRLLTERDDVETAWHLFAVRVPADRRRQVFDRLHASGIGTQVHYLPVYQHPLFQRLGYQQGNCPIAEQAARELLSLPLFPDLADAQQDRVVETLAAALR